jgi:AraC-like DNA-binding protein
LVDTDRCPELWARTAPIVVEPLLRALLGHLATSEADRVREHSEAIVLDLLSRKLSSPAVELPMPIDERARRVVDAILAEPTHPWGVEDWATEVGASTRTLSRVLLDETGMSFSQWRVQARLRLAMSLLVDSVPVAVVGRRVGYQTTSAFVSAFRRLTGVTPGLYASNGLTDVSAVRSA